MTSFFWSNIMTQHHDYGIKPTWHSSGLHVRSRPLVRFNLNVSTFWSYRDSFLRNFQKKFLRRAFGYEVSLPDLTEPPEIQKLERKTGKRISIEKKLKIPQNFKKHKSNGQCHWMPDWVDPIFVLCFKFFWESTSFTNNLIVSRFPVDGAWKRFSVSLEILSNIHTRSTRDCSEGWVRLQWNLNFFRC